jgi:hypothetical protein
MGLVYHLLFFSRINPAAYLFGGLFVVEGLLFVRDAGKLTFQLNAPGNWQTPVLWLYALILYPIIGHFTGHAYPAAPTFGLPCPTTIFTFGVLLLADGKVPWRLLVIPVLWALIGTSAAFQFDIYEDTGLLVAAIISVVTITLQKKE